ncbi:probable protein S-acyltransferase 7 isoform X1 [Abrus precatorius]|uniref:S-acyltransferase n=1 Tax=Abrus precatorius TaxID=3816 RepID=A0A8B8MKE4_ABRPR|nr:probable protein S-acyltransferase 7 isoform X1 [Abrus precatorius]XP_027368073.1 probable protein S-acyltransferase 7 isoform X1 [Abrus precatorius]
MYAAPPPAPAISDGGVAGDPAGPSLVRTYRTWKGNNEFFLQGRLIFGPDGKSIFLTIFLIVAPVAAFTAFVAVNLLDDFPYHSGYSILIVVIVHTMFVLITLLLTSGRDPGIVPRNAYPPMLDESDGSFHINNEQNPRQHLPRAKEIIVNGVSVKIKYCDTCMLYRPPRCSHCSVCDNCVERFDHHCPWVGQCIGLRNYRFYYMFVFSATLLCFYIHGFCWVYIAKIMDSHEVSIWKAMIKTPASIALIIYSFISVWFVGGLTVFHTYLISTNQSTYENFRYRYDEQVNPYDKGIVKNFKEIFCSAIPPSKNNFRSKIPLPKEISDSSRRRVVESLSPMVRKTEDDIELGVPVYNEVEEESDYKDEFSNDEELGKGSEISDMSVDLSRILHTEGGQRQVASILRHSLWERSSRKWDASPKVQDRITSDSSDEPSGGN